MVDQDLFNGQEGVQINLLGTEAQERAGFSVIPHDIVPKNTHIALLKITQSGDGVDRGGLAGTVRSEKRQKVAGFDLEADVIQSPERTVQFCETLYLNGVSGHQSIIVKPSVAVKRF